MTVWAYRRPPSLGAMTLHHAAGLGIALRACVARAVPGRSFAALMRAIYPRIEAELACVDAWAPRGGTAVDVGAWYGPWTARMSRLADQVVTIEPNPALPSRNLAGDFRRGPDEPAVMHEGR